MFYHQPPLIIRPRGPPPAHEAGTTLAGVMFGMNQAPAQRGALGERGRSCDGDDLRVKLMILLVNTGGKLLILLGMCFLDAIFSRETVDFTGE